MEPIVSLVEPDDDMEEGSDLLTEELALLYGGNLRLPHTPAEGHRPFVYANFVSSLDGVVAYNMPGHSDGSEVSGGNEGDRFVLSLLRACADTVIVGASTLTSEGSEARTAFAADPDRAEEYSRLRYRLFGGRLPVNVILSHSGEIDLSQPIFHTEGVQVVILTAQDSLGQLASAVVDLPGTSVHVLNANSGIDPANVMELLHEQYGTRRCLLEGGPRIMGSFLAAGCVDELFLTLSPRVAGRSDDNPRPEFADGAAFDPVNSPRATLVSLRRQGSYLFTRYRMRRG